MLLQMTYTYRFPYTPGSCARQVVANTKLSHADPRVVDPMQKPNPIMQHLPATSETVAASGLPVASHLNAERFVRAQRK